MNETAKSVIRRMGDIRFATRYYVGEGIDIGSGNDSLEKYKNLFPLATSIRSWDHSDGDAQMMKSIADNTFQFVNSSHCLEHLPNWVTALDHWTTRLKKNGIIFLYLPHYDQQYWRPWNNPKHVHILTFEHIHDYLQNKNYVNILHGQKDLNHSFTVVAEKII